MSVYRISQTAFLAIIWVSVGLEALFLRTRFTFRYKIDRRWLPEDIFVGAAWIFSLANTCLWTVLINQIYITILVSRPQTTPIHVPEDIMSIATRYLRAQIAGHWLSYLSLWSIKFSFITLFHQLGNKYRFQRVLWWGVLVFSILCLGVCLGMSDYGCLLGDVAESCMSSHAIWFQRVCLRVTTALDIVTDAAIILLSGNSIWSTEITGVKKLALVGISPLTAFIIVIALIRVIVGEPTTGVPDPAWLIV
ncbi:hypothetical protein BJX99DRAFT_261344 [Aspergillus californicus]